MRGILDALRGRRGRIDASAHAPRVLSDHDFADLHPRFTWMRDFLKSIAPSGQLPGRQHIEPAALKSVLPLINIVEVQQAEGALRFRFRLVGSVQTEVAGREITGLLVDDAVLPRYVERITSNMRAVVQFRAPVYDQLAIAHPNREFIASERVYFPLAANGRDIDMLILIHAYPKLELDGSGTIASSLFAVRG